MIYTLFKNNKVNIKAFISFKYLKEKDSNDIYNEDVYISLVFNLYVNQQLVEFTDKFKVVIDSVEGNKYKKVHLHRGPELVGMIRMLNFLGFDILSNEDFICDYIDNKVLEILNK